MRRALVFVVAAGVACADPGPGAVRMTFTRPSSFWDAPFPSSALTDFGGAVDVSRFPNPGRIPLVDRGIAMLAGAAGFGLSSGVFFRLDVDLDPSSLPSVAESVRLDAASVLLIDLDARTAHPIEVAWAPDGGPFATERWLAILPANGAPLRPSRRYAAVITTRTRATDGAPLAASPVVAAIADEAEVDGLPAHAAAEHRAAIEALASLGLAADALAGLTTFRTSDPRRELRQRAELAEAELDRSSPTLRWVEGFDDFCVYAGELSFPDYQEGEPPFADEGGGWSRLPAVVKRAPSRLVVTVPRASGSADGRHPAAVFIRTGGGGDRPLVDRGVRGADGRPLEPGSGLARELARVGWIGVSVDGPHGGPRNPTRGDEQFLMFNFANPVALRDNVRQSALELALLGARLDTLVVDTASCAGAAPRVTVDTRHTALVGHSMGATIAPLVVWAAPDRYRTLVLSGAGASWIQNLLHKKKPLEVRTIAEALLGYTDRGASLAIHDPVLSLVQWALEPADPLVYAADVAASATDVVMFQGIVDHYIMPPIANALSLPLGLAQVGPALDATVEELAAYRSFAVERAALGAPASPGARGLGALVQYAEDGVEDGHEVMFQLAEPKAQLACLLRGLARGESPALIAPGATCD